MFKAILSKKSIKEFTDLYFGETFLWYDTSDPEEIRLGQKIFNCDDGKVLLLDLEDGYCSEFHKNYIILEKVDLEVSPKLKK